MTELPELVALIESGKLPLSEAPRIARAHLFMTYSNTVDQLIGAPELLGSAYRPMDLDEALRHFDAETHRQLNTQEIHP